MQKKSQESKACNRWQSEKNEVNKKKGGGSYFTRRFKRLHSQKKKKNEGGGYIASKDKNKYVMDTNGNLLRSTTVDKAGNKTTRYYDSQNNRQINRETIKNVDGSKVKILCDKGNIIRQETVGTDGKTTINEFKYKKGKCTEKNIKPRRKLCRFQIHRQQR